MGSHVIKMDGLSVQDSVFVGGTTIEPSESPPTGVFNNHKSFFGTFEIQNYIPENAEIVGVRANTGIEIRSMTGHCDYTESGYNCFFYPKGYYFEYGPFTAATLSQWIARFGHSQSIYYRVGIKISSSYWVPVEGGRWKMNEKINFSFYPWIEITYKDSEVLTKIKISLTEPTLGTQYWQRVSTYTAVDTPEGLKWAECEVRYCMVPVEWSDIPNASEEEQPTTTAYLPVGNDVERKILRGYTGTNATVGRRVRGNDNYRCFTIHNAPAGTYTVRFTCSFTCQLLRISHDGGVESVNITYQPGDVHEYTITTTTTDFLGFTFIFNSSVQGETFEAGLGEANGEPEWVLCGEEA